MPLPVSDAVYRHLTDDGLVHDGAVVPAGSNWNMFVDGSVTPVKFYIQAPEGQDMIIERALMSMLYTGNLAAVDYGRIAAGLASGSTFQIVDKDDALIKDLLDNEPLRNNFGLKASYFDADPVTYGAGANGFVGRWSFFKDKNDSEGLRLRGGVQGSGAGGDKLVFTVNDLTTNANNIHMLIKVRGWTQKTYAGAVQ